MTPDSQAPFRQDACPVCQHPLDLHNDAGTFQQGGTGSMCCYFNGSGRQFRSDGSPERCGCEYDGPGTRRY